MRSTKIKILSQFGLYRTAGVAVRAEMAQVAQPVTVARGSQVLLEGYRCEHLPLIYRGVVRVYKIGESGREITLCRVGPGETCLLSLLSIVAERPLPATGVAEEAVAALLVPARTLRAWADRSQEVRDYIFQFAASRMGALLTLLGDVVFKSMDVRLAFYLLHHHEPCSRSASPLAITHETIAMDLGTSREVVGRLLKNFARRGMVAVTRGRIRLIDPGSLRQVAAGHADEPAPR